VWITSLFRPNSGAHVDFGHTLNHLKPLILRSPWNNNKTPLDFWEPGFPHPLPGAKATQRILIGHARRPAGEEDRPWLVEAAGDIFATPPLRSLSEKTAQRRCLGGIWGIWWKIVGENHGKSDD